MKYIANVADMPFLYSYRKNSYRHRYVTDKLQNNGEKLLRKYDRPSALARSAKFYYVPKAVPKLVYENAWKPARHILNFFPRAESQASAEKKGKPDLDSWARMFYQVSVPYSDNCKKHAVNRWWKIEFELMELKTDGSHYEFLIRETIIDWIVQWQDLPRVNTVRQYLKKHPFPEDECYSEEQFLDDVGAAAGYVHLFVEKRQTAEFIRDLICELV